MNEKQLLQIRRFLAALSHFLGIFLFTAFIITCSMLLFFRHMAQETLALMGAEQISRSAKLTFLNIVFLSLVFTLLDVLKRRFVIDHPVAKIRTAVQQIMKGDLSVRIEREPHLDPDEGFNQVIDAFNQMAQALSRIETLQTDFIANVSHELKTPLAVMQNYATLLNQPNLSQEDRVQYAKQIAQSSRHMADMITNILKLNKLENQSIFPASQTYDLGEQLCECLLGFEDIWEKKEIEIETELEDEILVTADPELLSLVWNNLFSNAFKFTDSGGTVSLRLSSLEEMVQVQVSDTGCGMSPDVGAHIFEKFYQGDTSRAQHGNGLGLALVKRVIDIVGAEISVQSEPEVGSTFTVTIRRAQ